MRFSKPELSVLLQWDLNRKAEALAISLSSNHSVNTPIAEKWTVNV